MMQRMRRPFWLIAAAACALLVAVGIVGSVVTGMGWWNWGTGQIRQGAQQADLFMIADGGIRYAQQSQVPVLTGIPIVSNFFRMKAPSAWVPRISVASGQSEIIVPFWTVGAVALVGSVFAWRRARRAGPGECSRCGYDLKGLSARVCPECGAAISAAIVAGGKAAAA